MTDDIGRAITVPGEVNSSDLGVVMSHEHKQARRRPLRACLDTPYGREIAAQPLDVSMLGTLWRYPLAKRDNATFGRDDGIAKELARLEIAGGGTAVEMTCVGWSPDPESVALISHESGVHIVMGAATSSTDSSPIRSMPSASTTSPTMPNGSSTAGALSTTTRSVPIGVGRTGTRGNRTTVADVVIDNGVFGAGLGRVDGQVATDKPELGDQRGPMPQYLNLN